MEYNIVETLMARDGMDRFEAQDLLDQVRQDWIDGGMMEDPDEIMLDEFGLEADYTMDFLDF